jgi:hypothetical protein
MQFQLLLLHIGLYVPVDPTVVIASARCLLLLLLGWLMWTAA